MRIPIPAHPVFFLLFLPLAGCSDSPSLPKSKGRQKPAKTSKVVLYYKGVPIEREHVEKFLPYLKSYKPNESEVAQKRFALLKQAIPSAWAMHKWKKGYARSHKEAIRWLEEIKKGEISFKELAKRELERQAKEAGVTSPKLDAPTLVRSAIPLCLAKKLFQAEPGEVIGPISSHLGWHLIKVLRVTKRVTPEFDLVTFYQVVSIPGGREQAEEMRKFPYTLNKAKGSIKIVAPDYKDVLPLYLKE